MLLWFQTESFAAAVARARELHAEILEEPHLNPNAPHRECWMRDPHGYVVVLASAESDWKGGTSYVRGAWYSSPCTKRP